MRPALLLLAVLGSASAFTPTPAPPSVAERIPALIDHVHYLFTEKKDLMQHKITEMREKTTTTAMSLYAQISEHGRKMQTGSAGLTAWFNDVTNILSAIGSNPGGSSFQDALTRLQGATCNGASPKPNVVSGLSSAIEGLGFADSSADFSPVVTSLLNCMCSGSWDMSGPEYVRLWNAAWIVVQASSTGSSPSNAQVDELVDAFKPVVPLFMGQAGMCSEDCQTAMRALMTNIISVARAALPEVTFPAAATASYPSSSVGCICGINYAGMMDAIIPSGTSVTALVSSLSDPLGAPYFNLLKRVVTYMFGSGMFCGGQCPQALEDGQTISWTIGMHSAWPSQIQSQISTARDSQLPSESHVVEFSTHTVGCYCSLNYNTIISKAQSYIVPANTFGNRMTASGQPLNMIEDVLGTVMNGTTGSGGFCDTGACPAMVGSMMNLFTNISITAATNPYGSGSYVAVSDGVLTHQRLEQMFRYSPQCMCAYFEPDSTGNIFPLIRRKETEWRTNGFPSGSAGEVAGALFDVQRQAVRATKSCKSGACRLVFDSLFEMADAAAGSPGSTYCTADNSVTCTSSSCPIPDGSAGNTTYGSGCTPCNAATQVQPQKFPFGHMPDPIDSWAYWSTCAMSVECPAGGVRGYVLSNTFTMAGSVDTFNVQNFKNNYAELLAPVGSAKEGSVTAADISATVSAGSVVVAAEVIVFNLIVKGDVENTMSSLTTAQASSAFGVTVSEITPLTVTEMSFPPPAPPPAPGTGYGGASQEGEATNVLPMWAIAVIIAASVVTLLLIILSIVLCCCCCCKQPKQTPPTMTGIPQPGQNVQIASDKI